MMFRPVHLPLLLFLLVALWPLGAWPQAAAPAVNVQLANLRSDMDRLDQMVRSLRLEVEALRRENRETQEWVKTQLAGAGRDAITSAQLNAVLRDFEQKIQNMNKASRDAVVNEVSQEIERLAAQTRTAIAALAKSVEGQPRLDQVVTFSDDYPRTGRSYRVKSGDSLARIAREMGSRVEWIRNANRLASDTIFPGQELFIPVQQ